MTNKHSLKGIIPERRRADDFIRKTNNAWDSATMKLATDVSLAIDDDLSRQIAAAKENASRLREFLSSCACVEQQAFLVSVIEFFQWAGFVCDWEHPHILIRDYGEPHMLGFDIRIYNDTYSNPTVDKLKAAVHMPKLVCSAVIRLTRWNHFTGRNEGLADVFVLLESGEMPPAIIHPTSLPDDVTRTALVTGYDLLHMRGRADAETYEFAAKAVHGFIVDITYRIIDQKGLIFY